MHWVLVTGCIRSFGTARKVTARATRAHRACVQANALAPPTCRAVHHHDTRVSCCTRHRRTGAEGPPQSTQNQRYAPHPHTRVSYSIGHLTDLQGRSTSTTRNSEGGTSGTRRMRTHVCRTAPYHHTHVQGRSTSTTRNSEGRNLTRLLEQVE